MNKEDIPLVSVVLPSFNHEKYIYEAIMSVFEQSNIDIQLIVIDDCSTDNTVNIIKDIQKDKAFLFVEHRENEGIQATVYEGINYARGKYIQFFSSDDILVSNKLTEQVDYLEKTGFEGVLGNSTVINENSEIISHVQIEPLKVKTPAGLIDKDFFLDQLYTSDREGPLLQSGLFLTQAIQDINHMRLKLKSDDWAMLILLFQKYNIGFINKSFVNYRLHSNNVHNDGWSTFPMRIEVISKLVPAEKRLIAMAGIFESMAGNSIRQKEKSEAIKFYICSLMLHTDGASVKRLFRKVINMIILKR